jgi:hypothetical protein
MMIVGRGCWTCQTHLGKSCHNAVVRFDSCVGSYHVLLLADSGEELHSQTSDKESLGMFFILLSNIPFFLMLDMLDRIVKPWPWTMVIVRKER